MIRIILFSLLMVSLIIAQESESRILSGSLKNDTQFALLSLADSSTFKVNITENKKKLEYYFRDDQVWDNGAFNDNLQLKQDAIEFGYNRYTLCQARQEPLALNKEGEIFCSFANCKATICPFQANVAHGEELTFLNRLKELLLQFEHPAKALN